MQRPNAQLPPRLQTEIRRLEYLFLHDTGRQITLIAYEKNPSEHMLCSGKSMKEG